MEFNSAFKGLIEHVVTFCDQETNRSPKLSTFYAIPN